MKIYTVSESRPDAFDKKVNDLLKEGYKFHGPAKITTNVMQKQSDLSGRLNSWESTTYIQIMIKYQETHKLS